MKENENNLMIDGIMYSRKKPLVIAELGTSHSGDIVKAKEMTDAACKAGAACIKLQMVFADEILHPNTGVVPLPAGNVRLYDQFKSLEMPPDFYAEIKEYIESRGVLFLCTPFGLKSAAILKRLQPKMVKIASPELNFTGLLEEIACWDMPVLLSSGVSRLSDIENAIEIFKNVKLNNNKPHQTPNSAFALPASNICLLHCVTSYPAPETDYNLKVLANLAAIFGVSTGVSDHSGDPELVPALSVSMGASVIEKHFCLSRKESGLDDPIALEPDAFAQMVKAVNHAAGCSSKEEIIEYYSRQRGQELVNQILGSGVKELAESEKANYRRTNRSIHALRDIKKGEVIKRSDYAVLRTEKILRPGLDPIWEKTLEGR
ncbi:MAG: N-acetylneuraminate synthase family protein, partial [Treponema sp.]|nr:N-acetylneuraminate synthase family protein [Treponema sp.]